MTAAALLEVKDLDVTPISWPHGISDMKGKLGRAFQQLSVRSQWLSSAWGQWVRALMFKELNSVPDAAYLLPIVVTARYMPPFLFDEYVGVPVDGFRMFLAGLEDGDNARLQAIAGKTLVDLENG